MLLNGNKGGKLVQVLKLDYQINYKVKLDEFKNIYASTNLFLLTKPLLTKFRATDVVESQNLRFELIQLAYII
jgi:hypothetical protein